MDATLDIKAARRGFMAVAAADNRSADLPARVGERLLERLSMLHIDPRRILDLGCGSGALMGALGRAFPNAGLVAMDWSMPLLEQGPGKLGWRRRIGRVCADARRLPFTDRSLDLVVSNQVLHWLDDPRELFEPLSAAIAADGLLLFSTLGPDTLSELRNSWAEVDDRPHVHRFLDMHDIGDALLQCGFRDPVVDVERVTLTYADVGSLMHELKALGGANVARHRRRQLTGKHRFHGMLDHYEEYRQDGRIPATWEVIYGLAWGVPEGRPRASRDGDIATFSVDSLRGSRPPKP